jgi:hypothetical protein
MCDRQAGVDQIAFHEALFTLHWLLLAGAVGEAFARIDSGITDEAAPVGAPLALNATAISPLVRSFAAENGGGDGIAGGVFETLIRTLGPEVEASIARP